ncbi:MAG: FAD-dependent oxidoreductase [Actinomycetota bacterium]|nr:FAD-dependent oxidoreductase [Actinomycetota bacterium]
MRVVVVGGGLAGITCGWMLQRRGAQVTVLEARDRVGGRTYSHTFSDGTTVERGGEYIDAEHHEIRLVCAELGLPLIPHGITFGRRTPVDGRPPSVEDVEETLAVLRAAVQERLSSGLPDCSVHDLFTPQFGPDFAQHPVCRRLITSMASDPRDTSALLVVAKAAAGPYIDAGSRVLGGNQRIAIAMAEALETQVRLSSEVAAVEDKDSQAIVTLYDGNEIEADAIVIAVPLPLLATLDWRSPLPLPWRPGLDQLGFGEAAKLSLQLTGPATPLGVQAPEGNWWSWNSLDQHGDASVRAVTAFAGGPETVAGLSEDTDSWQKSLERCRPDLSIDPSSALLTDWQHEPYTRGAYSFGRVGWDEAHALDLQTRQGRIALAGEHTAGHMAATMNGAVASGMRAADVILPALREAPARKR